MKENYYRLSFKVSFLSIGINLLLGIVKLILAILSQSIAILSDCVHSLSDMATTLIVILSLKVSKKPADKDHPFGHGRVEEIGGLLIAVVIFLLGINFLKSSFLRLFSLPPVMVTNLFIVIIFITAFIKLFLGIITFVVSKKTSSNLLLGDAYHHGSDFFISFCIGLGLIFIKKGFMLFDPLGGILVSSLIVFWGLDLGRKFIDKLIGKSPSVEICEKIKSIAKKFPQVKGVHEIYVHSYGRENIISFHIELDEDLSLEEAHSVADRIEKEIFKEGLGKCIVHMDLFKKASFTEKKKVIATLNHITHLVKEIKDFHGLEIITTEGGRMLNFHLMLDKDTSLEESHQISHRIAGILKEKFGFSSVNIHLEPYK